MTFAPFELTAGEWAVLLGLASSVVLFVRKGFIPWMEKALENSIASDRGVRAAIQEALKVDLGQVASLRESVIDLTHTLGATNGEHQATRRAFADLQQMVHDLRAMMETELSAIKDRMQDFERSQDHRRRSEDRSSRGVDL